MMGEYKENFYKVLHQIKFNNVLVDLLISTHCHGCGKTGHVGLLGYVNHYCNKSCWRYVEFYNPNINKDEIVADGIGCKLSLIIRKSKIKSDYLHVYDYCRYCYYEYYVTSLSVSKYHWNYYSNDGTYPIYPMVIGKECKNECIKNREPITTGYNNEYQY